MYHKQFEQQLDAFYTNNRIETRSRSIDEQINELYITYQGEFSYQDFLDECKKLGLYEYLPREITEAETW